MGGKNKKNIERRRVSSLIDLTSSHSKPILSLLLQDKSTGKNIIFATSEYREMLGGGKKDWESPVTATDFIDEITVEKLEAFPAGTIRPRVLKNLEAQKERTKGKAEVFTP